MSKRVSNKRGGGGARSGRTHRQHLWKRRTAAARLEWQRLQDAQTSAAAGRAARAAQRKTEHPGIFQRVTRVLRRFTGRGQ